jgi:hypothetical protein
LRDTNIKDLYFVVDCKRWFSGILSIPLPFILGIEKGLPISCFLFRQIFLSFNPNWDDFIVSISNVFANRGSNGYFGLCPFDKHSNRQRYIANTLP